MLPIIETPNLGPVTISQHVVKHFSRLCDGDMDKASIMAEETLKRSDMERLEVPTAIASLMVSKGDNPDALEFWMHLDSSTMFLVKPKENYKLVEMAMEQDMSGIKFDNC
ncbi:hypothetical protein OAM26_05090 [Porticoccaceae bacterium]|nr:hypothetical protein [Porticoccaceae bacterium]